MAKTGHPNIVLRYTAPWRNTTKIWSLTFNYSGSTLSTPQQKTFAQYLHNNCFSQFFSPSASAQYLASWSSYDGVNSVALQEDDYGSAAEALADGWNDSATYGGAYTSGVTGVSGLETCVCLRAPLGLNSKGKPFGMVKYIHGVPPMAGDSDNAPFTGDVDSLAVILGDGSAPGNRVLCSDKGGQGTWAAQTYFGNHKLFRAYHKPGGTSIFDLASDLQRLRTAGLIAAEDA